ncbi:uncharacterized protein M6B38_327425 [Iris pallida]|uniref:Uncharacterized protein n=1 Tax=Iris pallida TaxID=29817 RepID=A0AAX6H6P2_IRIPA|nr:uncharacterized protein M6B38_327425 [Iris pallida]
MNKLVEFGRKAMFYVRVLSGYEERRIRAYRLQLQQRMEAAQAKKAELRRVPEKAILAEVRRMVEEMQALNKKLEETETAIEEYFKPVDMSANIIVDMQLKKEEQQMKLMMKAVEEEAMLRREMAVKEAQQNNVDPSDQIQHTESTTTQQEQTKLHDNDTESSKRASM